MKSTRKTKPVVCARSAKMLLVLLAAFSLIATACGGSSSDGETSSSAVESTEQTSDETSNEPTGEPLRVMTVTTLNAAGPTYQNIANTAQAYAEYINARGGIAGRPLEVTVCDEQFDPAVATSCAREATEGDMVSIVGSFTFFAESIVPVIYYAIQKSTLMRYNRQFESGTPTMRKSSLNG